MTREKFARNPASADAGISFARAAAQVAVVPDEAPAPAPPDARHLLGLEGMSREQLLALLDSAAQYREIIRARRMTDELSGISVCNAFFEDSTRTRLSFELAARRLGALCVTLFPLGSSMSKGETLMDTLQTIVSMRVDLVVVRHRSAGTPGYLARHLDAGIINAGDGAHEHPTQGLLDLLTLRDVWRGRFEGRRIAIVGDIEHSRVARSAVHGLCTLGARVTLAGPATLMPRGVERLACAVVGSIDDAMAGADAVMALRIQRERMEECLIPSTREYARLWGVTEARVRLMKPGAVVMHPGPFNRDVEIASDVVDGPRAVIWSQVENGAAVRCAVLARCARAVRRAWA